MSREKQSEEKLSPITRRDFLKGIAIGAVATAAVSAGVVAVSWPVAPPAPPGAVTKTETVTRTTTAPATTITTTATTTAPPVTTTRTTTATTTLPAVTTTVTAPAPPAPPPEAVTKIITLKVNGEKYELEVQNRWTLLDVLNRQLRLTGTKKGCDMGECGSCTVLMDGRPVYSCMMLAVEAEGKEILTIEGLAQGQKLHPIQEAFIAHRGFECSMCTPGMILTSKALLDKNPNPTREQVAAALSGNLCRCAVYPKIFNSVLAAAEKMKR